MIGLKRQTRRAIVRLLMPLMKSEQDARALLSLALGDSPVTEQIDLRGSNFIYVTNLVDKLIDYGTVEPGVPALWALLETAYDIVGVDKKQKIMALKPEVMALAESNAIAEPAGESGEQDSDDESDKTATAEGGSIAMVDSTFELGDSATFVGGDYTRTEIENLVINYRGAGDLSATAVQEVNIADVLRSQDDVPLPAALKLSGEPLEFEPLWILVPPGTFTMGSDPNTDPLAFDDEMPQHQVRMRRPYLIAHTPVTNAQYKAFVRETRKRGPKHWRRGGDVPDHPVTWVSWDDAITYCEWLTGALREVGRFPQGADVRVKLPTEAQWERAARGDGQPYIYPWGNVAPDETRLNFKGNIDSTTPVGKYPAGVSQFGCLDMAGNVWEWTLSLDKPYPYDPDDGRESPNARGRRILRGGAFNSSARSLRCAARKWNYSSKNDEAIGFRIVLVWG